MHKEICNLIDKFTTIVITRHKSPDLDAYGSQFGLYHALKARYPEKEIFVTGDTNALNQFGELDVVDDETLSRSLLFILDTAVKQMLPDTSYEKAKKVIIFDHHQNEPDIKYDIYYRNTEISSTAELVASFLLKNDFEISKKAAKPLFMGIVGDTGRFLFSNVTPDTFRIAALLLETGIELAPIYNSMYMEPLRLKMMKIDFLNSFKLTKNNVGYRKNDKEFLEKHQIDSNAASRMLANQLSGIKEIPIWANFTFDTNSGRILCELRSREIPIVDIAKKHGGGGHLLACGCNVPDWEETDQILAELDALLEEKNG